MKCFKNLISFIFVIIMVIPLVCTGVTNLTDKVIDLKLNGYFEQYDKPKLKINNFFEGTYQNDYTAWWNNNFLPRGAYIKTYNQIRYSLFQEGNRVIGKNGVVFEETYLDDYIGIMENDVYNYAQINNAQRLEKYVKDLMEISEILKKNGKKLMFYITPNKADYFCDAIPNSYLNRKNEKYIRGVEYLRKLLKNSDLSYIDSDIDLQNKNFPIYYKTGIHWSRPAETSISKEIMELIGKNYNKNIKQLQLNDLNISKNPYWRDADVYELLNLIWGKKDKLYYEYNTECIMNENLYYPSVLLQGGSFAQGFEKDFIENKLGSTINYINYNNYIRKNGKEECTFNDYSELDMQNLVEQSDIIIIEINEAVIGRYSDGFVEYLNEYLKEKYVVNKDSEVAENFDGENIEMLNLVKNIGYYGIEEGYSWVEKDSVLTLNNKNIKSNGMMIKLQSPEYLKEVSQENQEINIYVNGKLMSTVSTLNTDVQEIHLSAEQLGNADTYYVEIKSPIDFVPSELGINEDTRHLALKVYYIGEEK